MLANTQVKNRARSTAFRRRSGSTSYTSMRKPHLANPTAKKSNSSTAIHENLAKYGQGGGREFDRPKGNPYPLQQRWSSDA